MYQLSIVVKNLHNSLGGYFILARPVYGVHSAVCGMFDGSFYAK